MKQEVSNAVKKSIGDIMGREELTISMLADFAGVSYSTVYNWAKHGKVPNTMPLCRAAKVLRVTLDDLIPPESYRG